MNNRTGLIILILLCVGLCAGLIWSQKQAATDRTAAAERLSNYSNKWVEADSGRVHLREVNTALQSDLGRQRDAYEQLTNAYTEISSNWNQSQLSLQSARDEIVQRDAKIQDLQSQNQALDQRAADLGQAITNLTAQIAQTKQKLAASEGDKAFLEKELQRLMTAKAQLEQQFNDLAVVRGQLAKLKTELAISRRLAWMREGLFTRSDQKGAQQLMQSPTTRAVAEKSAPQPTYDLNVEVSADGTVRVIPPPTNRPAATHPAAPANPK